MLLATACPLYLVSSVAINGSKPASARAAKPAPAPPPRRRTPRTRPLPRVWRPTATGPRYIEIRCLGEVHAELRAGVEPLPRSPFNSARNRYRLRLRDESGRARRLVPDLPARSLFARPVSMPCLRTSTSQSGCSGHNFFSSACMVQSEGQICMDLHSCFNAAV